MAVYNNSIPTEVGRKLENQVRGGQGLMEFAYIEVGSGIYTEEDRKQARHMDSLKEARQRFFFSSISQIEDGDGDYLILESVIHNEGLEEGYHLTEVGIFARLVGKEETVLYCICLVDEPDYMPPQTDDKVYEIILHSMVKCYDAEHVTILYDDKTYATAGALMDHIRDKGNPHHVTKYQIGLGNVDDTADMDKPVSTAQQAAIDAAREQAGESLDDHIKDTDNPHKVTKAQVGLGSTDNTPDAEKPVSVPQQTALDELYQQLAAYTNQKMADLINGAPSSPDTLKEVADAIAAHKTIMDALDAAIGKKASAAEFDSHTKDTTKHVAPTERTNWNDANTKKHTHGNKSVLDGITSTLISGWSAKMEKTGDSADNTVTFSSGDATNPTGWADIGVVASGEKHSSLMRKFSLAVKNLRYLWKLLGGTSLAGIGDGTVTGAINALNTGLKMTAGRFTPANANYTIDTSSFIEKNSVIGIVDLRLSYTGTFPAGSYYTIASATIKPSKLILLKAIDLNSNTQCNVYFYQDGTIKAKALQALSDPVFMISGCFT